MIELNGRTRLTTDLEKAFAELGGADPNKTLDRAELSTALVQAIKTLREQQSPILERLYRSIAQRDPSLPSIESLKNES